MLRGIKLIRSMDELLLALIQASSKILLDNRRVKILKYEFLSFELI